MKRVKKMTKAEAIFLLIAGVMMGTVFTFGMQYWNAPITKDELLQVIAIFSSHEEIKRRGNVQEIILQFENYEQLYIDGVCVDDKLSEDVRKIKSSEAFGFMYMGIFCYISAAIGFAFLVLSKSTGK